jgi:hypothetical protein
MIIYHNKGRGNRPSYEGIAGRICLVQDFTEWGGVKGPFRVTSDDGRAVVGFPLAREWNDEERRWQYTDESDTRSDIRVEKSAIRASCDTASEAVALMEVSAAAQKAISQQSKLAIARMKALEGQAIAVSSDILLLSLDDRDEWVDAETGSVRLTVPLPDEFK